MHRDGTKCLIGFKRIATVIGNRFFEVGNFQFLSLADELMGANSRDLAVHALSARKADLEGQIPDVIADALFRITLAAGLHRRIESKAY